MTMKKRFMDVDIWEKKWWRSLTPTEKAAWHYVTSKCDNVGVWDADLDLADFSIGDSVDWEGFRERVNGNIEVLPNGKWWLVDFCEFQHPDLLGGSTTNACKSYVSLLRKHDLLDRFQGLALAWSSQGLETKVKVKVKEQVQAEEKEKETYAEFVKMLPKEYNTLVTRFGKDKTQEMITTLDNYKGSSGKKYKSDYRAMFTWVVEKCMAVELQGKPKALTEEEWREQKRKERG
jgi:hypothetical protein